MDSFPESEELLKIDLVLRRLSTLSTKIGPLSEVSKLSRMRQGLALGRTEGVEEELGVAPTRVVILLDEFTSDRKTVGDGNVELTEASPHVRKST